MEHIISCIKECSHEECIKKCIETKDYLRDGIIHCVNYETYKNGQIETKLSIYDAHYTIKK